MLLGWSVMHVQRSVKSEMEGSVRITLKEFENASTFLNPTEHKDMVVYQDDHTLFASLGAAAHSRTHSRSGLHGVEAAFMLCLLFSRQALALLHSHHFCHLTSMTETTSTATALRNIRKCIQLFGAFLSVTNCIPEA